ncbi:MAG: ATP-grasp domain-containing protein [Vicinamibacterales bacterium]|nr:ATP-grasp domain-containing protein [Vicinamibacterales bacterium]
MSIGRLLVANRGEIALRIIRACRELGIETVAVCSSIDAETPHTRAATQSVTIGPPHPRDSYLSIGAVIDAARTTGADAVHPGYGFLSESPEMAAACVDAGLIWVGPPADVIGRLGSKIEARRLMQAAGVPVVAGETPADQTDVGLTEAARRLGYPLLVKASAGAGGRGMRVVREPDRLHEALGEARREAEGAFGDGTLYVERLLTRPRHIEVQIVADHHGHVVHLFERECSIQRRHQKVIEESPAPHLTAGVRQRLTTAAVRAAQAAGYRNAGTVEFLVEGTGDSDDDAAATIAFLEMNTRLQVEHPVTEAVTGRDLVHAQLAVAAGATLPWSQDQISVRGHAIECRVYAEHPADHFLPDSGMLLRYQEPVGPGIRVDTGVVTGSLVSSHYDALLAKVITHADTRATALARAGAALARFVVLGVRTNIELIGRVLRHPRVGDGRVDTTFLETELDGLLAQTEDDDRRALAVAAALALHDRLEPVAATGSTTTGRADDPWTTLGGWRLS